MVAFVCPALEGIRFDPAAVFRPGEAPRPVRYARRAQRWIAREEGGQMPYTYEFEVIDAQRLHLVSPLDCLFQRRVDRDHVLTPGDRSEQPGEGRLTGRIPALRASCAPQ
jgi:hypothetical protein